MNIKLTLAKYPIQWRFVLRWFGSFLILTFLSILLVNYFKPNGHDWQITQRPAILNFIQKGINPYMNPHFFNPPWQLILLAPFILLPPGVDNIVLFLLTLIVFGYVAYCFGAKPVALACFLLTPQVLNVAHNGQTDWLVALGLILPRPIGLFLVLIKPQIGAGIALYWLIDSFRSGGIKRVLIDFLPVTSAFGLSFVIFGNYLFNGASRLIQPDIIWNMSYWPQWIPIGLVLLIYAIQKRSQNHAILASPFFSPYVAIYSWSTPMLGVIDNQWMMTAIMVCSWILKMMRVL